MAAVEKYVERVSKIYREIGCQVYFGVRNEYLYGKLQDENQDVTLLSGFGGFFTAISLFMRLRVRLKTGFVHLNGHRDSVFSPILRILCIRHLVFRHTELLREVTFRSIVKLLL